VRIPFGLRLAAAVLCGLVVLYLSLAPSTALPKVDLWDKAEHAIAYTALTLAWLLAFPRRPLEVAGGVFALGVGVELAQASMHFGRVGHLYDVVANLVGVTAGLTVARLARAALAR
jgi:VanZ family protein